VEKLHTAEEEVKNEHDGIIKRIKERVLHRLEELAEALLKRLQGNFVEDSGEIELNLIILLISQF
jgi:hypothetical protein